MATRGFAVAAPASACATTAALRPRSMRAGDEQKIVWRVTGTGPLRFSAPGCWTVHVTRADVEASLDLPVT